MYVEGGCLPFNGGSQPCGFQKLIQVLFQFGRGLSLDRGYVEIGLFSYFFDMNRKWNFIELVDELVDCAALGSFRSLRRAGIDQVAVETA